MQLERRKVAIFNDTSPGGHYGCSAVMQVLVESLKSVAMEPVAFWPCGRDWRRHRGAIRKLGMDALIVNGEGSIHHSRNRPRARFLAELGPFARDELKVPCVLLNASFHDLDPETIEHLKAFDLVFARESASQSYLRDNGIMADMVPDLSFFAHVGRDGAPLRGVPFVTDSVRREVSAALRTLSAEQGFDYEVMKYSQKSAAGTGGGSRVLSALKTNLSKAFTALSAHSFLERDIAENPGFDPFVRKIQSSPVVITGRFHTVTLCLSQRTPFVAFESNTSKISDLLSDIFGHSERCLPFSEENVDFVGANWRSFMPFSDAELAAIDSYLQDASQRRAAMLQKIGEIA